MTDQLTQVLNRRGFERSLDKELNSKYKQAGPTATIMLINLDDFKVINDTFGNATDAVLQKVSRLLISATRRLGHTAELVGINPQ